MKARPEWAGEAVRDEHVRQPHFAKHRRGEVASYRLGSCGLEGRESGPATHFQSGGRCATAPLLQNVVAGAGDGQLEEVQADAPAAARANRGQQAGRRQVVLSALTRRHVGQVRTYSSTAARCNVELVHLLRAKRARGRYAKAIAAPAVEVEQPVAADEGGARRLSCGGVLPLCRRRQGPQNRVRRECRANRGREVGVQKARPLSRGTSGHEGRSRGRDRHDEALKRRIRLVAADMRRQARAIWEALPGEEVAGSVWPGICTARYWCSAGRLSQRG